MSTPLEKALQKRSNNAIALLLSLIGVLFLGLTLSLGGEALSYTKKEKNVATITEIKTVNASGKKIYSGQWGERKTRLSPALPLTQYIATFSFETLLGKKYDKDVELKTIEGHNQQENLSPLQVGDKILIHLWFIWAYCAKIQNYKWMRIMFILYAVVLGGSFWNSIPSCEKKQGYEGTVEVYEDMGFVAYELSKNIILMVHKDSPTEIISAATEAQKGDHDAYLRAIRDTTTWEYKIETLENKPTSNKPKDIEDACNKQGKDGWELTSVVYNPSLAEYTLFFKKQIE